MTLGDLYDKLEHLGDLHRRVADLCSQIVVSKPDQQRYLIQERDDLYAQIGQLAAEELPCK